MNAHGVPSWSIPGHRIASPQAISLRQSRELKRLLFELRNLLENSGDLAAALDVVEGIERLMAMPPAIELPPVRDLEESVGVVLETLVDEALETVSPALAAAKVIVLRKRARQFVVFVERAIVMKALVEVLKSAVAACSQSPGLRIIRVRTRNGRSGVPELTIEHSGCGPAPDIESRHVARHVQLINDARDYRVRVRFLRGHRAGE